MPAGTGIYVYRAQASQSAYYAVSRVVDGQEDLSTFTSGNALQSAVAESTGTGAVVLQSVQTGVTFQYVDNSTLKYYVRWECPPTYNLPNTPLDYLIAIPNNSVSPRPIDVALHCWGGSLTSGYGWWYNAENGYLLVATNQVPYDWWTGSHENYGTADSFRIGQVYNYQEQRIISFIENFVKTQFTVDSNRIMLSGVSMGGSGTSMWGVRSANYFSYTNGWVGVHRPRYTPQFESSFEGAYGQLAWLCPYYLDGTAAFDYFDNVTWLTAHPTVETPYMCFSNGKNDAAIGWQQAVDYINTLIAQRRPFKFHWDQSGHGVRSVLPGPQTSDRYCGLDIAKNQPLPAFTHCSLDNNPGTGDPAIGDATGDINAYPVWETTSWVDTATEFQMTCSLISAAPQSSCTLDFTPRRCANFILPANQACTWQNTDVATSTVIQSGNATADSLGIVTITGLTVSKTGNRVKINKGGGGGDTTPPAAVSNLSCSNLTATSVQLNWTAPGDDGNTGTATTYDIRYSTSTITAGNWASATQISGEPAPAVAGTNQNMVISGLSADTTYYFAIETADEVPNWSGLSNVPSAHTVDSVAPAAVSNLATSSPTNNSITLTWTAPGDNGSSGTATTYDIRYSTSTITAGNWGSATQVTGEPAPLAAGNNQSMTITGLSPSTTYYFAIETADEVPNWSGLSNVPSGTTTAAADTTPPAAVSNLATSSPTGNSITLTWTAPGDDGNTGTATTYDIRYRTGGAVNDSNWASATQVSGEPTPAVAGTNQSMVVTGLSTSTTYYFAIKTADEVPNWSAISNSPSGTTTSSTITFVNNILTYGSPSDLSTTIDPAGLNDVAVSYGVSKSSFQALNPQVVAFNGAPAPTSLNQLVAYYTTSGTVSFTFAVPYNYGSYTSYGRGGFSGSSYQDAISTSPNTVGGITDWLDASITSTGGKTVTALGFCACFRNDQAVPAGQAIFTLNDSTTGTVTLPALGGSGNPQLVFIGYQVPAGKSITRVQASHTSTVGGAWVSVDDWSFVMGDVTAPAAVTNLATSSPTSNSITLTWTAPGDDGNTGTATTYDIRYSTSTITAGNWASATQVSGEPTPLAAGTNQNMTITGLSPSTTYYFAIETADEVPNWSALSNVPSGTTTAAADTTPPAAVSNLATSSPTASSITLTWTAPGDDGNTGTATTYDIRYSTSTITAGNWASATQVTGEPAPLAAGNNQSMTITGLAADTTYYFAIETADEVPNWSGLSNVPSGKTSDTVAPAAVSNLATSSPTSSSITLTWTAPGDNGSSGTATTYDIRYSTSTITAGNWASATQVSGEPTPLAAGNNQSMTVTGLSPSTTYYFAIETADEVPNWSALSNVPSGTTTAAAQPPITVLHIGSNVSGWRGGNNVSTTYCWLDNWPNSNADATIAQFDRTALQNAINTIYNAYGGWDAQMVVSQVNWNTTQPPVGMGMVCGSADLDPSTVVWESSTAYNAGNGNWKFNGTSYSDFATAVNAGTASSRTVVATNLPYISVWDTNLPAACWDVVTDMPESVINGYLQNSTALGLFASATTTTALNIHANEQWFSPGQHPHGHPTAAPDRPLDWPEHVPGQQDYLTGQPDSQPDRQRHQCWHWHAFLDGHSQPFGRLDDHLQRLGH